MSKGIITRIGFVSANTYREAIRARVFAILLAFAVSMIGFATVIATLSVSSTDKVLQDFGMTSINLFSVITAIFIGIGQVYNEIEKKTIYNILSKPIKRYQFVIGKYFGLMGVLIVNLIIMTGILSLILLSFGYFSPRFLLSPIFICLEILVLTATAIFFSSLSSPVVAAIFTVAFYLIGHSCWAIPDLLVHYLHSPFPKKLAMAIFYVLPDLEIFNVSNIITYDLVFPHGFIARAILYSFCYSIILLIGASLIFSRRDLT